ncbi:hypothetical protein [Glycomyces halotolerans]
MGEVAEDGQGTSGAIRGSIHDTAAARIWKFAGGAMAAGLLAWSRCASEMPGMASAVLYCVTGA